MEKGLFKKLIALITYTVLLVVFIIELDAVKGWGMQLLSALKPLLIGAAIAFILRRPCSFFARLYGSWLPAGKEKAARPLAVVTAYVVFFGVVAAVVSLVVPELVYSIETFVSNLGVYAGNLQKLYDFVVEALDLEILAELNLTATIKDAVNKLLSGVLNMLTNTLPHLVSMTGALVSLVVTAVLSLVFSVYVLYGGPKLAGQIRRLATHYLPARLVEPTLSVTRLTVGTFDRFLSGQLIEAVILGSLCFVGMCLFRFDYAPLISVIVGVSALVPILGAYFGAIVSALLLVMIQPMQAVWFLVFLLILQQLEGNLIYPRVVGTSIGLPAIWVLAAVTLGNSLFGFVGLVASVPVTAVLYTLLRRDLHRREGRKTE